MDGEKLRDGIFALSTRRFGSVPECMIKHLLQYSKGKSVFHDLYDEKNRRRVEVKGSRVLKIAKTKVTDDTVLKCIEEAVVENRMVAFSEWQRTKFDSNIQQVKRAEFEVLYYHLFFSDCVKIFKIESQEIKTKKEGGQIGYSDRQHGRGGEGQFHISHKNLQYHLDHYPYKNLSYDQLYKLLVGK